MSSDRDYTDSELRLLACYKALQDIKEGKRKPSSSQPQAAGGSKQAVQEDASLGSASAPLLSSSGQKLPSRIRLKATRQQGPAASGESGPSSPSAPRSPAGQASAEGVLEAAAAAEPEQQQQPQATISRQELAALLRRKKLEESKGAHVDPLLLRTSAEEAAPAANTAAAPAPTAAAQPAGLAGTAAASVAAAKEPSKPQPAKAAARAKLPLPGAPKTPKAATAGPTVTMAEASKPPAAAAAAPVAEDIDYGAVSSPEYDVDYDAVSSPEYDAVSGGQRGQLAPPPPPFVPAAAAAPAAADAAEEKLQPLPTPESRDGSSSSNRHALSASAAVAQPKPPLPRSGNDAKTTPLKHPASAAADATPAAARRRSGSRSCSRSPAHRRSCGSSRQRSPEHRRRSRSRSRSRSPSLRHRRRSSSRRQQRSRSRGRGSWQRRSSPDYNIGARRQGRGSSPSSSEGSPVPRQRRGSGSRPSSRQGSRQPQQQQQNPTLFVGDLPPVGFSSADLQEMFSGHGWSLLGARVMGSQCYGFVEFEQQSHADEALALVSDGDPRFSVNGGQIRASWARGSMPDWKRGKAVLSKRDSSQGLEGLEAYEHPMARMLRLQAAAVAAQAMAGVIAAEFEPEEGQVAVPQRAAAAAVAVVRPVWGGVPAMRALVDYGDL